MPLGPNPARPGRCYGQTSHQDRRTRVHDCRTAPATPPEDVRVCRRPRMGSAFVLHTILCGMLCRWIGFVLF